MASIRKRGDLQWEVRIRRKGWPVTCKTFNTKGDAEKWARDIENEMDRGAFTSRTESENTTLEEALERFIVEYISRYNNPKLETIKARALHEEKLPPSFWLPSGPRILRILSKSVKPKALRVTP